jgi:ubiquinone/menaquinone biosynthesis C-methylase UbiE
MSTPEPQPEQLAAFQPESFRSDRSGSLPDEQLAALVTLLDLQAQTPSVQRLQAWALDSVAPEPGETAVDVGSGTGGAVCALAELVGQNGRAVGVEPNGRLRELAEARAAAAGSSASFVDGDALHLPFDDSSVDIVRSERVLQHLDRPDLAVHEMARILRPGGRVVILDSDWGSVISHPVDRGIARRLNEATWERMTNPFSARQLPGLMVTAGLDVDWDIGSQALVMPPERLARFPMVGANADAAVEAGRITAGERDAFMSELREAADAGVSFFAVTMFSVTARKPTA